MSSHNLKSSFLFIIYYAISLLLSSLISFPLFSAHLFSLLLLFFFLFSILFVFQTFILYPYIYSSLFFSFPFPHCFSAISFSPLTLPFLSSPSLSTSLFCPLSIFYSQVLFPIIVSLFISLCFYFFLVFFSSLHSIFSCLFSLFSITVFFSFFFSLFPLLFGVLFSFSPLSYLLYFSLISCPTFPSSPLLSSPPLHFLFCRYCLFDCFSPAACVISNTC